MIESGCAFGTEDLVNPEYQGFFVDVMCGNFFGDEDIVTEEMELCEACREFGGRCPFLNTSDCPKIQALHDSELY